MTTRDPFAELLLQLHRAPTSEQALDRLVHYAREVTGCTDAGVLITHSRKDTESVAATSERARRLQDLQAELGEGPCLDGLDQPLDARSFTPSFAEEQRWPSWAKEAVSLGYRSAACVPLSTGERRYGSVNLYSESADGFDEEAIDAVALLTEHAALAIGAAFDHEGLRVAMQSRKIIGVASGIIMATMDVDEEQAFAVLKRLSQDRNVKLRDLAEVISRDRRLTV